MRIAQVAPSGELPWSGVLTVVVGLAAALARRGHHVEVWQLHDWNPREYGEQLALLDEAGVAQVGMPGPRRWWQFGGAAARTERDRRIDLVHLHSVFNPPNTAIARALRTPYVLSPHGGYDPVSLRRSRGRKRVYASLLERPMLHRAAAVVALTAVEREQIEAFGRIQATAVVPNGVRMPGQPIDETAFRRELGLGPDDLLAVFAGRLDVAHKGLDLLVEAVAKSPGWRLALVGGDHRGGMEELRRLVDALRLGQRVTFAGVRHGPRLREALAGADLFALTSRWEGLPMALLEALCLGTPALVSPPVERLVGVAAAGAGWVAHPRATGALMRELEALEDDGWAQRGEAARRLARRYDWDAVARRYERVYAGALGHDASDDGARSREG